MQNIFGQNLLNRRKALGLTQEQLAVKLKVDAAQNTLSNIYTLLFDIKTYKEIYDCKHFIFQSNIYSSNRFNIWNFMTL